MDSQPGLLDWPPTKHFFFAGGDEYEDLTMYGWLGLHPILLGDILPKPSTCTSDPGKQPRYNILLKLGSGGFATVWLARDLAEERRHYVAIKICKGCDNPSRSSEAEILGHIQHVGLAQAGHNSFIRLHDVFTIKGPNGFHECLVTEVVASLDDPDVRERSSSSRIIRQMAEGFDFLHSQGIIHGDPHIGNVGIALPQLDDFDEDTIFDYADTEIVPVVPRRPSIPRDAFPAYIVERVSIGRFLMHANSFPSAKDMQLRILDFGRAHWANGNTQKLPGAVPIFVRPPEVIMYELYQGKVGSFWSKAADIWAAGCMMYEVRSRAPLMSTWGSPDDFFYRGIQLGGPPPKAWLDLWDLTGYCEKTRGFPNYQAPNFGSDTVWQSREDGQRLREQAINFNRKLFRDMIRRMLVTDPSSRYSMAEILRHEFWRKSEGEEDIV